MDVRNNLDIVKLRKGVFVAVFSVVVIVLAIALVAAF